MKAVFYLLIIIGLQACCWGKVGCPDEYFRLSLRLVDKQTEKDLVFGNASKYNSDSVFFYTYSRGDSVSLGSATSNRELYADNPYIEIYVGTQEVDTVFVRLGNANTDTLKLDYPMRELRCCPDIRKIKLDSYNGKAVEEPINGVFIIRL